VKPTYCFKLSKKVRAMGWAQAKGMPCTALSITT
jgi:hypothetical protein